jgi:hypothetical protein
MSDPFNIDINEFNINLDPKETPKEYATSLKFDDIIHKRIRHVNEIMKSGFEANIQHRIVTFKPICAITIIEYLLQAEKLTEIYLATYSINKDTLNKLKYIVDKHQVNCTIIMSDFFSKTRKHQQFSHKISEWAVQTKGVKVKFTITHAKVFLSKTESGKHIVFEGSGNLAFNARIEQYLIENNINSYNFHKQWMEELF